MHYINCTLCNIDFTHLLVTKDGFNIVQCRRCGLVYVNPQPDNRELRDLYCCHDDSYTMSGGHTFHNLKKFKVAIDIVKKQDHSIHRTFDLGCSTGLFLELASNQGWEAYGTDINPHVVEKAQHKHRARVKLQLGSSIDFPDRFFDLVTLFDTIEHLPDPLFTLMEVSRILTDSGLVLISTPNIEGIFPKLTYNALAKTIGAWDHPTPPGHLFQFSRATLLKTLDKTGFEWLACRNFHIYMPYTVGQLKKSIIAKLKEKFSLPSASNDPPNKPNNITNSGHNIYSLASKKLPRILLDLSSWSLVVGMYPIANLLDRGDSMIVLARKRFKRQLNIKN